MKLKAWSFERLATLKFLLRVLSFLPQLALKQAELPPRPLSKILLSLQRPEQSLEMADNLLPLARSISRTEQSEYFR
jgi:hypothetical protein